MKTIFTAAVLFLAFHSFSQTPDYFEDNPQWRMEWNFGGNMPCLELHDYMYYINGDSIVNDISYKKLYERHHLYYDWQSPPPAQCTGTAYYENFRLLIRQENKKVFVKDGQGEETLLYDFNLQTGDTLPLSYNMHLEDVVITGIDSIQVGTSYRKIFILPDYNAAGNNLIEGVGFETGLIDPFYAPEFPTVLNCFVQNDTTYYPNYGEACDLAVSIVEPEKDLQAEFYPNPVTDQLTIELATTMKITHINCTTPDGRNMNLPFEQTDSQKLIVDFSGKPAGMYLIHVFAENQAAAKIKVMKRYGDSIILICNC